MAPLVIFVAAVAVFAVIPFGSVDSARCVSGLVGHREPIRLVVAPGIDVGLIYVFAVGSIAVYGVVLGGWASNNKYGFLGGLRSSAQLISYELPLGLGIAGVVLVAGSLRLDAIIAEQARTGVWNVFEPAAGIRGLLRGGALPRPNGSPSTCPRPSRNSSAATTRNTRASS